MRNAELGTRNRGCARRNAPASGLRTPHPALRIGLLLLLAASTALAAEPPSAERLAQTIAELCSTPHRLAGTPEGRAAGDAIVRRLREAGFDDGHLVVQPFEMIQLRLEDGDCYFEREGQKVAMQPLRPNGLALPVTPPEGIEADTVYLADGRWEQFDNQAIMGRIAVLDYNCGGRWTRAVQAGAVAILFAGSDDPAPRDFFDEGGSKCFYAHLDIPRFFVSGEMARLHGLRTGAHVRLFSRMGFRRTEGRNILAFVPGKGQGAVTNEVLVLACHYDSFGTVPFAARNPSHAGNVAALIEAAAALRREPAERPVVVAFFDNEAQQQAGQFQFHFARDAYDKDDVPNSLRRMIRDREAERAFLEARLTAIRDPAALMERRLTAQEAEDARQEVLRATEQLYNRRVTELSDARRDLNLLDRQVDRLTRQIAQAEKECGQAPDEAAAARIGKWRLDLEKAERARQERRGSAQTCLASALAARDSIYSVRKLLTAGRTPGPDSGRDVIELFDSVTAGVRARWEARLKEQSREREILETYQDLGARLDNRKLVAMIFWNMQPAPRRWAVLGPAEDATDSVSNLHALRWLAEFFDAEGLSRWPGCAGYVPGVPSPAAADVSGRTTFVLELANPGVVSLTPPPTEAAADADSCARHGEEALALCREFAARPELGRARIPPRLTASLAFNVPVWTAAGRYDGCFVRQYDERYKAGEDVADAAVFVQRRWQGGEPPGDRWGGYLTFSSKIGTFGILTAKQKGVVIQAALHDGQGKITHISLRQPAGGLMGVAGSWEIAAWYVEDVQNQVLLGEVKSRAMLAGIRTPTGSANEETVKFIDAMTESPPKQMNLSLGGDMAAIYTGRLRQYKLLQGSQLLLGNSPSDPAGSGCEIEPGFVNVLARSARDTWTLDESRLNNLRRRNVMENALERMHARAERLLDQASQKASAPGLAWALNQSSLGYSDRVYEPVRTVTNDLVKAVVILLLLAIPFAFASERAVFGSANVYLQILGFVLIFGAVFTILYLVHPAFRFVSFPAVVLLAFVIIIMSSVVIAIMWSKFEYEVRKLHGLATASHRSTRTARGTVAAAVSLGIATMRRRPLRSVLTAVTILLLTFTILFFGSFKSEGGVRMIYVGPGPRTPLVEIGSVPGNAFDGQTVAMLRRLYEGAASSYVRGWSVAAEKQVLAGRLPDDAAFSADGQAALPPEDLDLYPELRQALRGDVDGFAKHGGIFLPPAIYARVAEPEPGGPAERFVEFAGRRYVLRGTFDPARLKALRTLDGASFVPPNLKEVNRQLEQEYPNDPVAVKLRLEEMELEDYPPVDPETIALVWDPRLPQLTMPVRSLTFLPGTEGQAREMAGEIATLLSRRASVAVGGDHFRALYATQWSLGGIAKVVVPLMLGGLIIFGTMLSSVSDRQREIFTFSALGLGPRHVGALFFAEAVVYAVVGGMGGYLFTHVFARLVEAMARCGWVEAPVMNHSSMNAMLTLLIVMATVLASTLYPAFRASRSANPGAQRQWRMPEPEGDLLRLVFPFTVSSYDMVGLVTFLEEYLLSHREKSVGLFAADVVEVRHEGDRFTLSATAWLQPFDQGISQTFTLWTQPGAIAGIDQVHVEMRRLSGSPAIWRRSSRVFIHDLRNQFILWRTIPEEAAEHYHRVTSSRFALREEGRAG